MLDKTELKTELGVIMHKEFDALQTCDFLCGSFKKKMNYLTKKVGEKFK